MSLLLLVVSLLLLVVSLLLLVVSLLLPVVSPDRSELLWWAGGQFDIRSQLQLP